MIDLKFRACRGLVKSLPRNYNIFRKEQSTQAQGGDIFMENRVTEKIAEIKREQSKYQPEMTYEDACRLQREHNKKIHAKELTLEEINQIIAEVRNNA